MKKITAKEEIILRVDGTTTLHITPQGCLASDAHAAVAVARLGGNITVKEISLDEAKDEALATEEPKKAPKKASKKVKEEAE